jgi:hypothetical protein
MSKTKLIALDIPLITFNSDTWASNDEYMEIAVEILEILKDNDFQAILIQNEALQMGSIDYSPIIMVNSGDFGGLAGTLDLYIKDIIYELIPDEDDEE